MPGHDSLDSVLCRVVYSQLLGLCLVVTGTSLSIKAGPVLQEFAVMWLTLWFIFGSDFKSREISFFFLVLGKM